MSPLIVAPQYSGADRPNSLPVPSSGTFKAAGIDALSVALPQSTEYLNLPDGLRVFEKLHKGGHLQLEAKTARGMNEIYRVASEWPHGFTVSRIDLALDMTLNPAADGTRFFERWTAHRRRPYSKVTTASDGGRTLNIWKGASRRSVRIYDKGIESKTEPPGTWWRMEWQLRRRERWSFPTNLAHACFSIDPEPAAALVCRSILDLWDQGNPALPHDDVWRPLATEAASNAQGLPLETYDDPQADFLWSVVIPYLRKRDLTGKEKAAVRGALATPDPESAIPATQA